jgi:hypothetical protein
MNKSIIVFFILLNFIFSVNPQTKGGNNPVKILLVYENTIFKKQLIDILKNEFGNTLELKIIEQTKKNDLSFEDPSNYNLVFITNSGVLSKVRPWALDWILKYPKSKNIILHTTQVSKWEVKVPVDTITSASSDVKKMSSTIIELIKSKIQGK